MRLRILLVPLVASAALLAGCTTANPSTNATPTPTSNGLEAKTADEILTAATQALKDAKSFRAKGKGESDGQPVEVDLLFAGSDVKGTITFDGASVEVIQAGGASYLKADAEFWKMFLPAEVQSLALPLVTGKYVKVPSNQSPIPTVDMMLKPLGDVTKGEQTTVAGKKVITVETADGKLHVSLEGKPYPVDLVSDDGTIEFTDIDADATVSAPAASEVFDLSAFGG
jgi:hypothetical protein